MPPAHSRPSATNPTFLCTVFVKLGLGCLFTSWSHGIYLPASVRTFGQAVVKPLASDSSNVSQKVTQGHTQIGVQLEVHKPRQEPDFDLQPGSQTQIPSQPCHVVRELPSSKLWGMSGAWGACPPNCGGCQGHGVPVFQSVGDVRGMRCLSSNCEGGQGPGVPSQLCLSFRLLGGRSQGFRGTQSGSNLSSKLQRASGACWYPAQVCLKRFVRCLGTT